MFVIFGLKMDGIYLEDDLLEVEWRLCSMILYWSF